jgi:hypothetical protein
MIITLLGLALISSHVATASDQNEVSCYLLAALEKQLEAKENKIEYQRKLLRDVIIPGYAAITEA